MPDPRGAPPQPGGSGTFSIATWNIRSGRNGGLEAAAKSMASMGVGFAICQEAKVTTDAYTRYSSGMKVLCSVAPSPQQGGMAVMWDAENPLLEVEAVRFRTPHVLTAQLVTGRRGGESVGQRQGGRSQTFEGGVVDDHVCWGGGSQRGHGQFAA